jgi:hypothetical protein
MIEKLAGFPVVVIARGAIAGALNWLRQWHQPIGVALAAVLSIASFFPWPDGSQKRAEPRIGATTVDHVQPEAAMPPEVAVQATGGVTTQPADPAGERSNGVSPPPAPQGARDRSTTRHRARPRPKPRHTRAPRRH